MSDLRDRAAVALGILALRLATPTYRRILHEVIRRGMADMDKQLAQQAQAKTEDKETR